MAPWESDSVGEAAPASYVRVIHIQAYSLILILRNEYGFLNRTDFQVTSIEF